MHILRARTILSLAAGHLRRSATTNCSLVEKSKETKNLKSWKEVPGPPSLPFLGVIHHFLPGGEWAEYTGSKLTDRLFQMYGPVVKFDANLGGKPKIFLFDPEAVEYVLQREEPLPVRPSLESLEYFRKRHNKRYDPDRVTGLGTDHGKAWKKLRTTLNPILMQPKSIEIYATQMDTVADDMITRLRSVRDGNDKIPKFDIEMSRWSLESVALVALGTRLHCLDPGLPEDSPVRQLIENVRGFFSIMDKLDLTPSAWKIYSTPTFKKAMRINEEIERLTKYFIDQAIKIHKGPKKETGETSNIEKSVLEKLLEIDYQLAVVTATETLFGGVHSVANTVMGTLYLLATNPEKQSKLREEILNKQGQKRYLKACISETLRRLPPGIGTARLTTKEHHILGYKIPTDIIIMFGLQTMSNMQEYFPRPEQYIPERWLAGNDHEIKSLAKTQLFATIPFGFGVRTCAGRRIAQLEMETLISKLIENFQVEWPSGEPIQIESGLVNTVMEPFHFTFKDL